jgi:hypothetical protein
MTAVEAADPAAVRVWSAVDGGAAFLAVSIGLTACGLPCGGPPALFFGWTDFFTGGPLGGALGRSRLRGIC